MTSGYDGIENIRKVLGLLGHHDVNIDGQPLRVVEVQNQGRTSLEHKIQVLLAKLFKQVQCPDDFLEQLKVYFLPNRLATFCNQSRVKVSVEIMW